MPKITTPPKVQLTIRIDEDVLERLDLYAKSSREPKSLVMQKALLAYLDSVNAPWPHDPSDPSESANH